jgi:hypothetical protein
VRRDDADSSGAATDEDTAVGRADNKSDLGENRFELLIPKVPGLPESIQHFEQEPDEVLFAFCFKSGRLLL